MNSNPKFIWKNFATLLKSMLLWQGIEIRCLTLAILTFCLCALCSPLLAQSGITLKHADISRGERLSGGEELKILEGNVHVLQDTVEIFCDRATYYPSRNMLVLIGNVKLIRGNETLSTNKLTYYEDKKLAIAEENVFIQRPQQNLTSDYLEYYYETDRSFARGNLKLSDLSSNAFVTALQGDYLPQQNFSRVEKNAHFWQVDSASQDTLHIYAETMEYHFEPERKAVAKDSVRIIRGDLTASCDSAIYLLDQEKVFLEINPHALQANNEMTGQQMELDLGSMILQQITIRGRAMAKSVEDSTAGKVNQLTGQEINAFFIGQAISQLWAVDNARSLYYLKDQGQDQGINTASADTIRIYFQKGEVDNISVKGGSQGTYYPTDYKGEIDSEY